MTSNDAGARQMAARDAVLVYDETDRHLSNIVAVYVFDESTPGAAPPHGAAAVDWMRDRLGYSPIFRQRLRQVPFGFPYWVPDPDFDIHRHVHTRPAADWAEARRRIADIASTRMDLTRPPWEIHVMNDIRDAPHLPGPATIVVLKFHHSACDGVATRALEARLFAPDAVPARAESIAEWSYSAARRRAVATLPYHLVRFAVGLKRTRAAAARVRARAAAGELHEPEPFRPATRFNRRVRERLAFDTVEFSFDEIKAAKDGFGAGVTVNDLLLTVVSGALAAYLGERNETPPTSLAAMVPMSMRGIAQWNSSNQLAQLAVDLHTDIADPVRRLRAITRSAARQKQRQRDSAVLARESRVETAPAWLLRLAGWARARRVFDDVETVPLINTTISNVPRVAEDLAFGGAGLAVALGVLPIMDGDGLRHLITSQGDRILLTFSADPAMLPDPARYGELLLGSFRALTAALERSPA
ncbi:wax ester/triacylglycerol synthase family O-acyltransferase [Nocardia sp. NPDC127579]|uniref:wax ester/triacylglycerol synthase family O-acyltransferase n=1 Tax=Nocardia sp. NPDC127579 TaxID=3345402 RepID=UPI00363484C8